MQVAQKPKPPWSINPVVLQVAGSFVRRVFRGKDQRGWARVPVNENAVSERCKESAASWKHERIVRGGQDIVALLTGCFAN